MPMHLTQDDAAAGTGTNGGRRPKIVAAPAAMSPELSDRPRRRTFTVQDKLRILAETDGAAETGEMAPSCAAKASILFVGPDRLAQAA